VLRLIKHNFIVFTSWKAKWKTKQKHELTVISESVLAAQEGNNHRFNKMSRKETGENWKTLA